MPLRERIQGLRGMKIGVAPHPPVRLRALLATQGLTDKDVELVILKGRDQNEAFRTKQVDALYAHTPYLEQAIVRDDGVLLVEQTRAEVKELSNRVIHALAFPRAALMARAALVQGAVRAVAAAERSIHESHEATVAVLAREYPARERGELDAIVSIYEPAIPVTPDVGAADLAPGLAFFPDGVEKPDLSAVDLTAFVAPEVAPVARADDGGSRARAIVALVGAGVFVAVVVAIVGGRRRRSGR